MFGWLCLRFGFVGLTKVCVRFYKAFLVKKKSLGAFRKALLLSQEL